MRFVTRIRACWWKAALQLPLLKRSCDTPTRVSRSGIYSHVVGNSQREAVEKLAAILRPNAPKLKPDGKWIQVRWGERWDLNPRPSVPQTDALPAELRSPLLGLSSLHHLVRLATASPLLT